MEFLRQTSVGRQACDCRCLASQAACIPPTLFCKYHIVFAPKYRRKVFFENKRLEVGKILRDLCNWKGVNIIEGEVCPDHVHMFVENKVGGTCACTMSRACRTTAVCRRRYHQK